MIAIGQWFINNWQLIIAIGVLILILSMTGTITETYRSAKRGVKQVMTPMGFMVFLALIYVAYLIYLKIVESF